MTLQATRDALSLFGLLQDTRSTLAPERAARVWTTTSGGDANVQGGEFLSETLGRLIDTCFEDGTDTRTTHVLVHAECTRSGLDLTLICRPPVQTMSLEHSAALAELRRLGAFLAERKTSAGETCTFIRIPAVTVLGDAA
jgi:hypothetical protein